MDEEVDDPIPVLMPPSLSLFLITLPPGNPTVHATNGLVVGKYSVVYKLEYPSNQFSYLFEIELRKTD